MLWVKCIQKIRNDNNIITDYEIADLNGEHRVVTKDALKNAIVNRQVSVVNLKLSKDGKLMDRSIEEQASLMKQLNIGVVTEKDTNMYNKARVMEAAPLVNDRGETIEWPDADTIYITPNVKFVSGRGNLTKKTLIFTGNNQVNFDWNENYHKAIVLNPTVVSAVAEHKFRANIIEFNFDNMDLKLIDIIFKTLKDDADFASRDGFDFILVDSTKMNCTEVYNRVVQILKRQKPSSKADRRCYDIVAYLRLIYSMYLSFKDNSILSYAIEYIDEYNAKLGFVSYNTSFGAFVRRNSDSTNKLIDSIRGNK